VRERGREREDERERERESFRLKTVRLGGREGLLEVLRWGGGGERARAQKSERASEREREVESLGDGGKEFEVLDSDEEE